MDALRTRPRPLIAAALVAAVIAAPGVGSTGAAFTSSAGSDEQTVATAVLAPVVPAAERDASGAAVVTWDEPASRPDVATQYALERTILGETEIMPAVTAGSELEAPPSGLALAPVTAVESANTRACAVAGGEVYCWGRHLIGSDADRAPVRIAGILEGRTVTAVSLGYSHSCAIADGEAYCWGANGQGQLGDGTTVNRTTPVKVVGALEGRTVTSIAAGEYRTCAIADARAYCWGEGPLGDGSLPRNPLPVAVGGALADAEVTAISSREATCAVADGAAYCWGDNYLGTVGDGTTSNRSLPTPVSTAGVLAGLTVTDIVASERHTCAVAEGRVFCWGENTYGGLGDGTTTTRPVPVAVQTSGVLDGVHVESIDLGYRGTCALADEAAYCWGRNNRAQLGDGTTTDRYTPVAMTVVPGPVTHVALGQEHVCAVADGELHCWGSNNDGQLGLGLTDAYVLTPTRVDGVFVTAVCRAGWDALRGPDRCVSSLDPGRVGLVDDLRVPATPREVFQLSAGPNHVCAVASGLVACWGRNVDGQLGDGTATSRSTPVQVEGLPAGRVATRVSAGSSHSCAIVEGAAYCWGDGGAGQLGHGTTVSSLVPVAVTGLAGKTVTDIIASSSHTCAVADGRVYCWGWQSQGAIGDGVTGSGSRVTPYAVGGALEDLVAVRVAASREVTCAVAHPPGAPTQTTVYCWGLGTEGRLGNGSTASRLTPTAVTMSGVLAGRTVTDIAAAPGINANQSTVCVIADGDPFCWGSGASGQLGTGSSPAYSTVPVAVVTGGALPAGASAQLSMGSRNVCVVADGTPYCWGLRFGTSAPTALALGSLVAPGSVTQASMSGEYGCLVDAAARAYCWGTQSELAPRIGDGTISARTVPVAVDTTGVLGEGGCRPGWVPVAGARCVPAPDTTVTYRIVYEKAGWSVGSGEVDAVWTGGVL